MPDPSTKPLATQVDTASTPSSPNVREGETIAATPHVDFGLPQGGKTPSAPAHSTYQEYSAVPSTNLEQKGGTQPVLPAVRLEGQAAQSVTPFPQVPPSTPTPIPPPYAAEQQRPLFLSPPPQQSGGMPIGGPNAQQAPVYGTPQPRSSMPYPPPVGTKKRLSGAIVALILILALLLVSGGVGLIYYTAVARPAQLHAQATSTAQAIQTNNARSTAVANAQATGTSVAYSNATATVQTQATAQSQATATALQGIYTQSTQGTPALNSSLAAQDNNNWDVNDTVDGGGCGFNAGTYHATLFSKNFYFPCFARASNFGNFTFQAEMVINQGDEGGLVFRSNTDSQAGQYYLFGINQNGTYQLVVSKNRSQNTLLAQDTSPAIKTGINQTNLITVVAKGSTLYLYINKQYIGSVSDNTYGSGMIGVFASDSSTTTDVSFKNAQIWQL